ncbi:hypothetical protein KC332_g1111 [Hortaea werneckii]|nr:hypothetical protein KC358_g1299 [Hortaea werneckii]KAI6852136.1 hypothetical protein KC350_g1178 [Hortaea werneckii]KAI6944096.1 hypothetical protein KC341_g1046 [Hortaea werneckii]KAI6949814.1 hypothetical protein KC348_g1087 [Hortaea werneckii]KAI6996929.1 hypothetical protein KC329_g1840 [Hortaea werneckii]
MSPSSPRPRKKPRVAENGSPVKASDIRRIEPTDDQGLIPPRHRARRTWIFDTLVHRLPGGRRETDSEEARKAEDKRKAARSQEVEDQIITLSSIRSKARLCEADAEVIHRLILNFLALSKHLGATADEHQKAVDMTYACMHIVVDVQAVTKLVEEVVPVLREDDKVLDFNSAYGQMKGHAEEVGKMVLSGEKLMKGVESLQGLKRQVVAKKFKDVEERAWEMIGAIEKLWVQDGI